jgi:hypothetical protein
MIGEETIMRPFRWRLRTLMLLILIAALLTAGGIRVAPMIIYMRFADATQPPHPRGGIRPSPGLLKGESNDLDRLASDPSL